MKIQDSVLRFQIKASEAIKQLEGLTLNKDEAVLVYTVIKDMEKHFKWDTLHGVDIKSLT